MDYVKELVVGISIDEYLKSVGYRSSSVDSCINIKQEGASCFILSLYVDDILMALKSTQMLQKENLQLSRTFDLSKQGEAYYIYQSSEIINGISIK